MSDFQSALPTDNTAARQALYDGDLYLLSANCESRTLIESIQLEIDAILGSDGPVRTAQFRLSEGEFFERMGRLRKHFYTSVQYHELVYRLLASLDFIPVQNTFDPIRLRVVAHQGHTNPAAAPVYYGHRDTWYSNPQSMITWWIPLHDLGAEETFEFFPEEFTRPVQNDSEVFDFDAWVHDGQNRRIGWQNANTGLIDRYPQLLEEPRGRRIPVVCRAGEILLFSAQHLHQTRPNMTGRTRFSIDFRTVHLVDHEAGSGARNVDNRSTGSSLVQFVRR
jgi:hypothetical protein